MADWEIKKTIGQCSGTGREFAADEEYFATLVETEGGFERRDYSLEHWQKEAPSVYCFWKTRMPRQNQKKRLFVDDEMLLAFFDRLAQDAEQEKINFRFVLALILMRKRRLRYESSRTEDGREIWTVRITGQDRFEQVINPKLTEDQIQQLSSQMGQILNADFD